MNKTSKLALYLIISLLLHGAIFGFDRLLSVLLEKNIYSVKQAPSSIRVVVKDKKKIDEEEVIIEPIQADVASMVLKKKKKPELQKPQDPKDQKSEESKGAKWDEDPSFLQNPAPGYPEIAKRMNWQGVVHLRIVISPTGSPTQVEIAKTSGHRVLDEAALITISSNWKFSPAKMAGISIESTVILPIRFQLTEE